MKTLLIALLLAGCGTYEVPKTEVKEAEDKPKTEERAPDESKPDESKPVEKKAPKQTVKVEVETKVTVTVGEDESAPNGEDAPTSKWRYVERRRTFANAEKDTPEGYRLPKRSELMADFEAGLFGDYTGDVWTSDHAKDRNDHVYFFKLSDGQSFAYPVESLFGTLYITKANDDAESDSAQED